MLQINCSIDFIIALKYCYGYDLKQLFVGAEGTLGIITKAVLKLFPAPKMSTTVLTALPTIETILALFKKTRELCGDQLTAFELIMEQNLVEMSRIPMCRVCL